MRSSSSCEHIISYQRSRRSMHLQQQIMVLVVLAAATAFMATLVVAAADAAARNTAASATSDADALRHPGRPGGAAAAAALPSEAARYTAASATSDADALRYPGRPGGARPRSPIYPGFPGARPSPPTSSGFPGTPSSRSSPAPVPGVPSAPPCPSGSSGFPLVPGFPGLPGGGSTPSSPTECVTPLAALMTCGSFLTGSEQDTPTPQSECCSGLGAFLNTTGAAGDGDDRTLRCLCPVILGDVNKMLPKPVDPVRMMYLPIACGVVLPPQVLYICFTGKQTPPLVGRIPDVWEKPSAALSP